MNDKNKLTSIAFMKKQVEGSIHGDAEHVLTSKEKLNFVNLIRDPNDPTQCAGRYLIQNSSTNQNLNNCKNHTLEIQGGTACVRVLAKKLNGGTEAEIYHFVKLLQKEMH